MLYSKRKNLLDSRYYYKKNVRKSQNISLEELEKKTIFEFVFNFFKRIEILLI